jgi:S-adenosylmethionine-dependent methyltransferase
VAVWGATAPPPGTLPDLVRLEVGVRQLARHLPRPPARVLDVGSRSPGLAVLFARAGSQVLAVQPDQRLHAAALQARAAEPQDVRARLTVTAGSLGGLADVVQGQFDAVTCHDALGRVDDARDVVVEVTALVAQGGVVSLLAPSADGMALPPALRGRWSDALDLLGAAADARPVFVDVTGASVRAHRLEELASYVAGRRMHVEGWYGIGTLTAGVPHDRPTPEPGDELTDLLAAEDVAGRTDPYRRVAPLVHLVGRRRST